MIGDRDIANASRPALWLACSAVVLSAIAVLYRAGNDDNGTGDVSQGAALESRTITASDSPSGLAAESPGFQPDYATALERAMVSADPQQRETAFNMLLPDLLMNNPAEVVSLHARQSAGEARDQLRDEIARRWIVSNRETALAWVDSLPDAAERQAAGVAAVRALAATSPELAIAAATRLDLAPDGSVEHIAQIWATEDPEAALRWLIAQPDDARNASTRERVQQVLAERVPRR